MKINRTTTVQLVGRGAMSISPTDHLATGGEGTIYRSGNTVIKLYLDQSKMAAEGIVDKIGRLAQLSHPYLIAPRGIVTDRAGKPLGWYMDFAPGEPLARAFTNDWRSQHKFGDGDATVTAAHMLEVVRYAHDQQAVMADANELNWTVVVNRQDGPTPRSLDVDSWQIGRWPARAIMPSIRDFHTKGLSQLTDWFAWGVVTFQLFTGLHPYKGMLAGYKPGELERRMRDNASVFSAGVRLNRAVRDFACVPVPLLDWYEATFQNGERMAPPSPLATKGQTLRKTRVARISVTAAGALRYDRLYDGGRDGAEHIYSCGVVRLVSGKLYDLATGRIIGEAPSPDCEVVRHDTGWLVAWLEDDRLQARVINSGLVAEPAETALAGHQIVRSGNRLFLVASRGLTELKVVRFSRTMITAGQTWGALPSTSWFDGVGVQDTMGATHLVAPFGDNACAQVRVPELDGKRCIGAKAGPRFVSVMTLDKQGTYSKIEFTFDRTYQHYTVRVGAADSPELNITILPRGVAATIVRDGELVIFVPSSGDVKRVPDKDADTTLQLAHWDERVVAIRDGSVWSLKLGS